jgi:tetratricopeptide (TPR) repeat protein
MLLSLGVMHKKDTMRKNLFIVFLGFLSIPCCCQDKNPGTEAFNKMKYSEAVTYFEKQLDEKQTLTYTNYLFLGRSYNELSQYNKAIEAFNKAIEMDNARSEAYYFIAKTYLYGLADINSANDAIDKAIERSPKDINSIIVKGDVLCGGEDFENGIKEFERALLLDDNNINALNSKALAYYYSGNEKKALEEYWSVLQINSINKDALLGIASIYTKQQLFDSAEYFLNISLNNYPNDNVTCSNLAYMYLILKNYPEAIKYYSQAIEIKYDFNDVTSRGFAYIELGEYGKAKIDFESVIKNAEINFYNQPRIALAYNNLGYVEYKFGDNSTALKHINKSIELLPNNSYAYRNLALIMLSMNDNEKACEALNKAKSLKFSDYYGNEVDNLIKENCN